MNGIVKAFKNALERKKEQGWEKIYILIDIHDTIFKACYENEETYEPFPHAIITLQYLTRHPEFCLILWTSTYPDKIDEYVKKLKSWNISFDMINDNSEVSNTKLSCFDYKPYFNVGIDDRFGFDPNEDWKILYNYLIENNK